MAHEEKKEVKAPAPAPATAAPAAAAPAPKAEKPAEKPACAAKPAAAEKPAEKPTPAEKPAMKGPTTGQLIAARVLGAAGAGIAEIFTFHPVDTIAKRLMTNSKPINEPGKTMSNLNKVIFKNAADKGVFAKYLSLFPGISFGVAYKLLQRVYKFGGQPFVDDVLTKYYSKQFKAAFGDKNAKSMLYATSGSLVGVGEVILLPLDVLKIKAQTNPAAFAGKGLFTLLREEGMGLYRGTLFTAARNAPGSFALFGGNAFTKEFVFKLKDYKKASTMQTTISSTVGAVCSILISSPFDVVKTRIQRETAKTAQPGSAILMKMWKTEGLKSFFKGTIPKVGVIGPKLIFSFTIAQRLTAAIETSFGASNAAKAKAAHH